MTKQGDMSRSILLSFDVEEFDIPEEYGESIEDSIQIETSLIGLKTILSLLEKLEIAATFFVTANFALHHPGLIKEISNNHEIASHGFYHSTFCLKDLATSKQILEELTGTEVVGFRMVKLQSIDDLEIERAGYKYSSSMNPTYLPGRYNNFFKKRTAYYSGQLLILPISVTPLIRFPLFWLSFKNFPLPLIKVASQLTINTDSYLNIYFHPWEFTDISNFKLPSYIKNLSGSRMVSKLENYLLWLKSQGKFVTISEFQTSVKTLQPRGIARTYGVRA
ncbi:MAG TPA: polysaccharide deacetylase family protein [Allocoleopsis sp.]